jgi:hypothetical protein
MERVVWKRGRCGVVRLARKAGPYRVFLSYRRTDAWGEAKLLQQDLAQRFGEDNVFMDFSVKEGDDFPTVIEAALVDSDVVLVLIGERWLSTTGGDGERRLDDPKDWVRHEIELAGAHEKRIIPVLLHGAEMPSDAELPETISYISFRQAVSIHRNTWNRDLSHLETRLMKSKPRNRFASIRELATIASTPALVRNALVKPCAIAFGVLIVATGVLLKDVWLVPVGIAAYLALGVITFFSLFEAESVGARQRHARLEREASDVATSTS